ncbi:Alpha-methylacyl-CoA racemase [Sphingobium chlorophenolicum L-1]|uniref:Alpha-methylacyl-CoA racemase n=1 Tax=Sphingobium chlorophenolicum L-1 TaxID=690566 RepID=F6EUJ0_SPHCR|nr:CaiB/BaiF CoA-transferase family protein [Sphingobium chlorophenolicum]AEG47884.1 Alpha-methylacyl-CoA racemase [Sphingobium chlorophenolicum L-1]
MAGARLETAFGPLAGVRVVEFGGIGPGPYCGQLLAEMGAEVLVIEREGGNGWPNPITDHGKARLVLDIRRPEGKTRALELMALADVVIEGFRPGVMERLGLGPDAALSCNPRLIYGRMTGWGQEGPLAHAAGHDINYIAITGALAAMGREGEPSIPPLNLVGDFGGGSLFLAFGIAAALVERERSGLGQVIDAAIVDGVTSMMSFFSGLQKNRSISLERSKNLLGGAAPFYRCYECADGKQVAVGALEPQFFKELVERMGAPVDWLADQNDPATWPERTQVMAAIFRSKTQAEWCALLEGSDACFAPVLTLGEAEASTYLRARRSIVDDDGMARPAPCPRFSRTPGRVPAIHQSTDLVDRWLPGGVS